MGDHMKWFLLALILNTHALALSLGQKAPSFNLPSESGKNISLESFQGKTVVLEWLNHGCPFVRKHYDSGNMQKIQKWAAEKNIIWLSIISSAPGKQGHVTASEAKAEKDKYQSLAHAVLRDESGSVGKAYDAKVTPHLFVINQEGLVVYQGAIDSIPSSNSSDIAKATNYVQNALEALTTGAPIKEAQTKAYGCSVKYK
jgi:peroxiredoxin